MLSQCICLLTTEQETGTITTAHVGVMGLSFMNRNLVKRFSLDHLLKCTTAIATIALATLCILFYEQVGGIYSIITMVFIFFSMNGMIAANSTAAALDGVPEMALL